MGEAHTIGDAIQSRAQHTRDFISRPHDGDRFEDFVIDQWRHLVPLTRFGHTIELAVEILPTMTLERWKVRGCGTVECKLFASGPLHAFELSFVIGGDDQRRTDDFEVVATTSAVRQALLESGIVLSNNDFRLLNG